MSFCTWGNPTAEQWAIFQSMGDVDGDGIIEGYPNTADDIARILSHFGETGPPGWIIEDLNKDGIVDGKDINICASNNGLNICDYFAPVKVIQNVWLIAATAFLLSLVPLGYWYFTKRR